MITGFHSLIYSDDADATRTFFAEVLEWPSVDAGGGWLIFKTAPSEIGVHPATDGSDERWAEIPTHQLSLMCDDINATLADLRSKGVEVLSEVEDQGFGLVALIGVPGAGSMQIYEPRHAVAHSL